MLASVSNKFDSATYSTSVVLLLHRFCALKCFVAFGVLDDWGFFSVTQLVKQVCFVVEVELVAVVVVVLLVCSLRNFTLQCGCPPWITTFGCVRPTGSLSITTDYELLTTKY